jgi:hypothetical protein
MASYSGPRLVSDGLVMCYDPSNSKCYSGSGTTLYDLGGGSGYTGTLYGSPTNDLVNLNINFNGNQMLQHNDYLNLSYVTVGVVYRKNSDTVNQDIIFNKENVWEMNDDGGILQWALYANNNPWFWSTVQTISTGVTYYVTLSYGGNDVRVHVNGSRVVTYTYPTGGVLNTGSTYPKFNSRDGSSGVFSSVGDRKLYHWNVYNRQLSDTEILANYNVFKSRYGI